MEKKTIKIKVEAIAKGYYKGVIIDEGKKFEYEGVLNGGKLPLWVKPVDKKEFEALLKPAKKEDKKEEKEEKKEEKKSIFSNMI
jgi:hypothetical protein